MLNLNYFASYNGIVLGCFDIGNVWRRFIQTVYSSVMFHNWEMIFFDRSARPSIYWDPETFRNYFSLTVYYNTIIIIVIIIVETISLFLSSISINGLSDCYNSLNHRIAAGKKHFSNTKYILLNLT